MHIERILLRDVGPFDDVTIEFPKGTDPKLADVYLLTGPNGTGKSTVLYALASVIGAGRRSSRGVGAAVLGRDLLTPRLRSKSSVVALQDESGRVLATAVAHADDIRNPFGDDRMDVWSEGSRVYGETQGTLPLYGESAAEFRPEAPGMLRAAFDWAAFAYAGVRSVTDVEVTAIQEPKQNPFKNSLSFVETADSEQLAAWVTTQHFRRLKAREGGNSRRADELARSVQEIEKIVAEVIGDPEFQFVINDQDDDVRIQWLGKVVRLGLLPDGLKSIVSWVADLLMRLDRIPWQASIPVRERSFLLLLDEVDIHLHPEWQRKVLPFAQRAFPNAQIIASTHSPFVVASVDDARIITLGFRGSSSVVTNVTTPQLGVSYMAVLRSIFGIDSEFDIDTEDKLAKFHDARRRLLAGDASAEAEMKQIAEELAHRSEELREVIALELGQLQRQRGRRAAP
jgi:predicted ATP-binding protein involved in virulence